MLLEALPPPPPPPLPEDEEDVVIESSLAVPPPVGFLVESISPRSLPSASSTRRTSGFRDSPAS
eukprot:3133562-Prorocentrum_lima.AAC.1